MLEAPDETTFAARSLADWRGMAEAALGGAPFESLVSLTDDAIPYGPIHSRRSPVPSIVPDHPRWNIVQRVDDPDPGRANLQALADLEAGAQTLALVFEGAPSARGFGLPLTPEAIGTVFEGIEIDWIDIRIEPHPESERAVEILRALVDTRSQMEFVDVSVDRGFDPIGCFAVSGQLRDGDEETLQRRIPVHHSPLFEETLYGRKLEADGRVYHEAGASEAQELGAVIATAVYYLRSLTTGGLTPSDVAGDIGFTLAADQRQFQGMAKFRALRSLWARVLELCGVEPPQEGPDGRPHMRIHAETSFRMMAAMDPHTNILRATVAAFAAATGGADSISVLPHTLTNGLPEAKARRLARNIQAILGDESHIGAVSDPGAGSGGIETLTDGIAAAAWDEFRRIESEGGILQSLCKGALQTRIAGTRDRRLKAIAAGEEAVIGVSLYPLEHERDVQVLALRGAPQAAVPLGGLTCAPLRPFRLTEDREAGA